MYLLIVLIVWIILGLKLVDWNNSDRYYPTILFYMVMNLLFDFVYYNHTLFAYKSVSTKYLNHTIISIGFIFIVIPIIILIFLQSLPQSYIKAAGYTILWSFLLWIIELLFYLKGLYKYENGWNVWHSSWFYILMFTLLIIHYKKPKVAWILSPVIIIIFLIVFPVPFSALK